MGRGQGWPCYHLTWPQGSDSSKILKEGNCPWKGGKECRENSAGSLGLNEVAVPLHVWSGRLTTEQSPITFKGK